CRGEVQVVVGGPRAHAYDPHAVDELLAGRKRFEGGRQYRHVVPSFGHPASDLGGVDLGAADERWVAGRDVQDRQAPAVRAETPTRTRAVSVIGDDVVDGMRVHRIPPFHAGLTDGFYPDAGSRRQPQSTSGGADVDVV